MNATLRAAQAVDNVVELPDTFAAELIRKPAGLDRLERLEDLHRVEVSRCSQLIADIRRKEASDLSGIAEQRAELDRQEAAIKAKALSEVMHLDKRIAGASAYLDAIAG